MLESLCTSQRLKRIGINALKQCGDCEGKALHCNSDQAGAQLTTRLFQPTYLLLETNGIRNVLLRQAKTHREKESALRALPSNIPNKGNKNMPPTTESKESGSD